MRLATFLTCLGGLLGATAAAQEKERPRSPLGLNLLPIYSFYNPGNGDHLFTNDPRAESPDVVEAWTPEGQAFLAADQAGPGLVPLYRFYKGRGNGTHFVDTAPEAGQRYNGQRERVLGYIGSRPGKGLEPLNFWYNPDADLHLYTIGPRRQAPPAQGFQHVAVIGYVVPPPPERR
jgi:hypothetical protein